MDDWSVQRVSEATLGNRPSAEAHPAFFRQNQGSTLSRCREQIALVFHGIGTAPSSLEDEEKPYWISRSFFLEIVDLVRRTPLTRDVLLTFDDGNESDVFAANVLAQAGLKGYFFLLTGRLGKPRSIDAAAARDISRARMEIGLHGHSHINWRQNGKADWQREIVDARSTLEDRLGAPVDSVAIPFGYYDRNVLNRLHGYKFKRIFNSDPGPTRGASRIIRRTAVKCTHSIEDICSILKNRCGTLLKARRTIVPLIKSWR